MRLQSWYQLGLQSSEGLTETRKSSSKMAHSQVVGKRLHPWLLVGGLNSCNVRLSPGASDTRVRARRKLKVFYDLVSEVTRCHFYFMLFVRSEKLRPAHIQGDRDGAPPFEWICGHPPSIVIVSAIT